ncbi:uncharacterized protein PV09_07094 [Verruconis gallopava]|uniref:PLOD1-3-like GT domain-containing protein n=1 Tax=Verruconis gallopava TaxID=253628 RepID=A0A0D2A4B3_9PEZI|nr:uncharacterized protein PV09_07094 [Verruconis gallopava]KIW01623.1 hypothetical protein PV09_07094 [Verruconis gallopava]
MTLRKLRFHLIIIAVSACACLSLISLHINKADWIQLPNVLSYDDASNGRVSHLHLLTVATDSNLNLCRLIFSSTVLSYPVPVLIDWKGSGEFNASESHLAKIEGPLRYLRSLPPHKDNDIVLLVDGYDVIFQLGPDVLLQRYFSVLDEANTRLRAKFGDDYVEKSGIYNSIIFGPDKTCFPLEHSHPRCWAVPPSPLPPDAFGPNTDKDMEHHRPRWLNSGTIMGPVAEVRAFFQATKDKVKDTFDPDNISRNSDQMYMANLFADQEYARTIFAPGQPELPNTEDKIIPDLNDGRRKEFHVGLDYESRMFQTCAGYEGFLDWTTFDQPSPHSNLKSPSSKGIISLQEDVLSSRKPFAAIDDDKALRDTSWTSVSLGVNMVSGFIFPVLHFTSDKSLRDRWWPRMWFYPHAERLLVACSKIKKSLISNQLINGTRWMNDEPYNIQEGNVGYIGAVSDLGEHLSWKKICGEHEETLYSAE